MSDIRARLLLLMDFFLEQTDEKHAVSARELIAFLELRGIPANRRAVYENIALLRQYGLPVDCAYPVEQMLGTILHDKKASGGAINLIVPTAVGSCEIRKTPASEISDWLRAGGAK